ncbi:hypothetical protein GQ53DRAFT_186404 [Thozetella sp. PMI_491]|nr:hypothetical protein GQ53DRAFT_186404 [Thozetella sp. PMI_491]
MRGRVVESQDNSSNKPESPIESLIGTSPTVPYWGKVAHRDHAPRSPVETADTGYQGIKSSTSDREENIFCQPSSTLGDENEELAGSSNTERSASTQPTAGGNNVLTYTLRPRNFNLSVDSTVFSMSFKDTRATDTGQASHDSTRQALSHCLKGCSSQGIDPSLFPETGKSRSDAQDSADDANGSLKSGEVSLSDCVDFPATERGGLTAHADSEGSLMSGSTSSGSSRSFSESERTLGAELGERKRIVVEHIMTWFKTWLDTRLALLTSQCTRNDTPSSRASTNAGVPSVQQPHDRKRKAGCSDQQLPIEEDEEDEQQGDEDAGNRKKAKWEDQDLRKLACPFYKHDKAFYHEWRVCRGPGWHTVHRVKEHIYRCHVLAKFRCNRCFQDLKDCASLAAHQRMTVPCEIQEYEAKEGFITDDQEKLLRRKPPRRKSSDRGGKTECEKWAEVYKIIFPDDDPLPSPYYETSDEELFQARASGVMEYASFMRREFPPLIRRELDALVDGELEERLRNRIVETMQGLQSELDRRFQQRHALSIAADPQADPDPQSQNTSLSPLHGSHELPDIFGLNESWWFDTSFADLDAGGIALSFPNLDSDSGYGSVEKLSFKRSEKPEGN